ncbi:putative nucleotidyltransferase substrate binding domain-containing protein [Nocardioides donggukensis]|uniref:Cyclic nucleotide-binding/CBS domain-containing protein n=1 Tax=Nocardioides donggukensis TaxID=2774019 RepID=A0A927K4U3_9ACTN|nr:putative nucleotidyltransferase substrate binding domain-containing protein [Nocardioides donggukensis]MBD8868973.1 cyclic nucleotide-binding/CBS domain-containing protein [Nocardioides donggukensis]
MALDVELAEIRSFLAGHPPFDQLPGPVLDALPRSLAIEYFRRGTLILARGEQPTRLLVVRSGAVDVHDRDGLLVDRGGAGTCVGGRALVAGEVSHDQVSAFEDTLVLSLPAAAFETLRAAHPVLTRFFAPPDEERLGRAAVVRRAGARDGSVLRTHVRDLVRRSPVTVSGAASVTEAARVMAQERVSSLLVLVDGRLAGILTDRDLRTRVLAAGRDPGVPVAEVMTRDPVGTPPDALALDVLLELVTRNIHHLPVVSEGRPIGMVTATDLLHLEQANPVYLVGDIQRAPDEQAVARLGGRLGEVVESLVDQDASADDIGRILTLVGDAVERRLLELAEGRLGTPPVPYAWLSLGSRARREQALHADQDHALLLDDAAGAEHAAYFATLAEDVTRGLEAAGYPRCPGEVMATNPARRVPLRAWRHQFTSWLDRPSPEAVLQASIYFDLRHVHGEERLTSLLLDHVRDSARSATLFLAHLAKEAAAHPPPLGFFRGLVLEKAGAHRDTLDIKRGGAGLVVKVARVHALAVGSPATNSRTRLGDAVGAGVLSEALGADLRDAWEFLSFVRLRHQAGQVREGVEADNFVAPDELSSFEKRHLREAFAVVRTAQGALGQRHPLHAVP